MKKLVGMGLSVLLATSMLCGVGCEKTEGISNGGQTQEIFNESHLDIFKQALYALQNYDGSFTRKTTIESMRDNTFNQEIEERASYSKATGEYIEIRDFKMRDTDTDLGLGLNVYIKPNDSNGYLLCAEYKRDDMLTSLKRAKCYKNKDELKNAQMQFSYDGGSNFDSFAGFYREYPLEHWEKLNSSQHNRLCRCSLYESELFWSQYSIMCLGGEGFFVLEDGELKYTIDCNLQLPMSEEEKIVYTAKSTISFWIVQDQIIRITDEYQIEYLRGKRRVAEEGIAETTISYEFDSSLVPSEEELATYPLEDSSVE